MDNWISVKDRLPENDNLMIVLTDINNVHQDYDLARYKKIWDEYLWETLHSESIKPTHWQSLPEPPTS